MPPLPKEKEILFFYHASTQLNSPTQNHSHTLLDLMQRCYIIYLYLLHIVYNIHTIYTIYQQANSASRAKTFTISSYCPQPFIWYTYTKTRFPTLELVNKTFSFFLFFQGKTGSPLLLRRENAHIPSAALIGGSTLGKFDQPNLIITVSTLFFQPFHSVFQF